MRSQTKNPMLQALSHLLAPGGRYPAEHVNIFWNEDEGGGRVRDLEIVFVPRGGFVAVEGEGLRLWDQFAGYIARWNKDMGNACDGWMVADGLTPAQIFGHLLRVGFSGEDEMIWALRELAWIEGDKWAGDMLSAFVDEEEVD